MWKIHRIRVYSTVIFFVENRDSTAREPTNDFTTALYPKCLIRKCGHEDIKRQYQEHESTISLVTWYA